MSLPAAAALLDADCPHPAPPAVPGHVCQQQGNGNAFLHAYWNALMAFSQGSSWAKLMADAHERNQAYSAAPPDRQMDYDNNAVGRSIGTQYRSEVDNSWVLRYSSKAMHEAVLSQRVRQAVNSGQLKRLVRPADKPKTDCTLPAHAPSCKFYYTTGSCNSWVNMKRLRRLA